MDPPAPPNPINSHSLPANLLSYSKLFLFAVKSFFLCWFSIYCQLLFLAMAEENVAEHQNRGLFGTKKEEETHQQHEQGHVGEAHPTPVSHCHVEEGKFHGEAEKKTHDMVKLHHTNTSGGLKEKIKEKLPGHHKEGLMDKIKEKLPGHHKEGLMDKIKEKLPGYP